MAARAAAGLLRGVRPRARPSGRSSGCPAARRSGAHYARGMPLLALLLVVLPIVELYVIVQVAQGIGVLETIGLLVLVALLGIWVVRVQGLGVLARMQRELSEGKVPTSLLDGVLILVAGVLLVAPGFVTDIVGVVLLVPPTRALVRRLLVRRYRNRVRSGVAVRTGRFARFGSVIVVDGEATSRPGDEPPGDGTPGPPGELPRG